MTKEFTFSCVFACFSFFPHHHTCKHTTHSSPWTASKKLQRLFMPLLSSGMKISSLSLSCCTKCLFCRRTPIVHECEKTSPLLRQTGRFAIHILRPHARTRIAHPDGARRRTPFLPHTLHFSASSLSTYTTHFDNCTHVPLGAASVSIKAESLQVLGSFKIRGIINMLQTLAETYVAKKWRGRER